MASVMLRYPETFVSPGRGLYALRNWGIFRPPFLKDFLAEALRERGGKSRAEDLASLGSQRYGFKNSSLLMTLAMNPHLFRDLGGGTYELL